MVSLLEPLRKTRWLSTHHDDCTALAHRSEQFRFQIPFPLSLSPSFHWIYLDSCNTTF